MCSTSPLEHGGEEEEEVGLMTPKVVMYSMVAEQDIPEFKTFRSVQDKF